MYLSVPLWRLERKTTRGWEHTRVRRALLRRRAGTTLCRSQLTLGTKRHSQLRRSCRLDALCQVLSKSASGGLG
jgi:hypothetical protein